MWKFGFVVLAMVCLACDDDDNDNSGAGNAGGGVFYGSCDSRPPAGDPCVDYYCDSASDCSDPETNGETTCVNGGASGEPGTWSTTPCPTDGVIGTCSFPTTGDGRLDNHYYTESGNADESVCAMAGGTWTSGE